MRRPAPPMRLGASTLHELVDALEQSDGDLATLYQSVEKVSISAEKISDAVMEPSTFPFGEYSVTVPTSLQELGKSNE